MATKGNSSLDQRGKVKRHGALCSCAAAHPWGTCVPLSPPFSLLPAQAAAALTAHVAKASAMDHEGPALYFSISAIPYNRFFQAFFFSPLLYFFLTTYEIIDKRVQNHEHCNKTKHTHKKRGQEKRIMLSMKA